MSLAFSDLTFREEWESFFQLLKLSHSDLIKPIKKILYLDLIIISNYILMSFYVPLLLLNLGVEFDYIILFSYLLIFSPLIMFIFEPYTKLAAAIGPWHFKDGSATNVVIDSTNYIRMNLLIRVISCLGVIIIFYRFMGS